MKYKMQILVLVTMLGASTMHAIPDPVAPQSSNVSAGDESTTINNNVTVSGTGTAINQTSSKSSSAASNVSQQSVLDSIFAWLLSGWTIDIGNSHSRVVIKT